MATREQAVAWLKSKNGKGLNFDKQYGFQCVDLFNYYYLYITGSNPYVDGYGVPAAKNLWDCKNPKMNKVKYNHQKPTLPKPGAVLIYNSSWGVGYGHVEIVISANSKTYTVLCQNSTGLRDPSKIIVRQWAKSVGGLIGWLDYKGFKAPPKPAYPKTVTVKVPILYVRDKPTSKSKLAGSRVLTKGMRVTATAVVTGEKIAGNNKWYKSRHGNFFWQGGTR